MTPNSHGARRAAHNGRSVSESNDVDATNPTSPQNENDIWLYVRSLLYVALRITQLYLQSITDRNGGADTPTTVGCECTHLSDFSYLVKTAQPLVAQSIPEAMQRVGQSVRGSSYGLLVRSPLMICFRMTSIRARSASFA